MAEFQESMKSEDSTRDATNIRDRSLSDNEMYTKCPICSSRISIKITDKNELSIQSCDKCTAKFKVIVCPSCQRHFFLNKEVKSSIFDCVNIKCPCGDEFYITNCAKCGARNKLVNKDNHVSLIKCTTNCNYNFIKVRCPFKGCEIFHPIDNSIEEINSSFPNGIKFKHNNKNVRALNCSYCNNYFYYLNKAYNEGQKIHCPYCNQK